MLNMGMGVNYKDNLGWVVLIFFTPIYNFNLSRNQQFDEGKYFGQANNSKYSPRGSDIAVWIS